MKQALIAVLIAGAADAASAQLIASVPKSSASGIMVSVSGRIAHFQFENQRFGDKGDGVAAMVGYGFGSTYAIVVTGSRGVYQNSQGSYDAEQFAVGGRVHMTNSQWRWVPYLELAIGTRRLAQNDAIVCGLGGCAQGELLRSGAVYAQTLGVSFYPLRRFALTLAGHANMGQLNAKFDGQDLFQTSGGAQDLGLSLGATWVIGGRR